MTILQALKKIKQLTRKIHRTSERIERWASYFDDEIPLYTDINKLIQSATDMQNEIARLRHAMHKLNATQVVTLFGKETTIDEMLIEATITIPAQLNLLNLLRRKEKGFREKSDRKVVLQYDPKARDVTRDKLYDLQQDIHDALDQYNIQLELDI